MKAITRLTAAGFFLLASAFAETKEGWTSDLEAAFRQAEQQDKNVLVEFTGSDWCPPCILMRENVFSTKEFVEEASEDFVLVELDFPQGDPALRAKNEPYARKYGIEGFPTVILFDAQGREFTRFFASEYPEVGAFLAHLDASLRERDLN